MTSKTLFRKLYKDECKRTLWIMLCIGLLFLFLKPIFTLLQIDGLLSDINMTMDRIKSTMMHAVSFAASDNSLAAMGLSIFLALLSFSWLFAEKKVNLTHTIPLKREKLFFVYYCNGLTIFFIPYIVGMLLQGVTIAIKGLFTQDILKTMIMAFLYTCIYFLLYYHATILAVMLTGNILVCIAATGVFIMYAPVVGDIISNYFSYYMDTYYMGSDMFAPSISTCFTSPLSSQLYVLDATAPYRGLVLGITILISLAILLLCVILYTKRSSESAGKALSFPKTASVIRILIVIPCALLGGLYIRYMSSQLSAFWYWFAIICAGILAHCVMEIIFHFDFKAAFGHRLQLLLALAVSAVIALGIQYDWLKYDSYLPAQEEVASAAVYLSTIDMDMNYLETPELSYSGITYLSRDKYLFDHMKLTDIDSVLALAKAGIEESSLVVNDTPREYDYDAFDFDQPVQEPGLYYAICYTMNSGRKVYRNYYATINSTKEATAKIFNSAEYKSVAYQFDFFEQEGMLKNIKGEDSLGNPVFALSGEQMYEFLAAYEKDMNALTYEEKCTTLPVMRLLLSINSYTSANAYYVYPDFSNTFSVLQRYNIDTNQLANILNTDQIESITVSHYRSSKDPVEVIYDASQADKIKELGTKLFISEFMYANPQIINNSSNLQIQVVCKQDNGIRKEIRASIALSDIPDFLKEDLRNAVK